MKYKSKLDDVHFFDINKNVDERGWLTEVFRHDSLDYDNIPEMGYVSMTLPGVERGPHEHKEQSDMFAFIGPGDFELHLWENRDRKKNYEDQYETYLVGESNPTIVTVPPGVVHGYKNISDKPGYVFNGPNRLYAGKGKQYPVDEIRHEDSESKFKMS